MSSPQISKNIDELSLKFVYNSHSLANQEIMESFTKEATIVAKDKNITLQFSSEDNKSDNNIRLNLYTNVKEPIYDDNYLSFMENLCQLATKFEESHSNFIMLVPQYKE